MFIKLIRIQLVSDVKISPQLSGIGHELTSWQQEKHAARPLDYK
jgi:hypothetical protein